MVQEVAVSKILDVAEIEPAIFVIDVTTTDGKSGKIRLNAFALRELAIKLQAALARS